MSSSATTGKFILPVTSKAHQTCSAAAGVMGLWPLLTTLELTKSIFLIGS